VLAAGRRREVRIAHAIRRGDLHFLFGDLHRPLGRGLGFRRRAGGQCRHGCSRRHNAAPQVPLACEELLVAFFGMFIAP